MKITDVKLIYAKHYLFVHVYTDEGIVGLGEAGNWGYLSATAAAIKKFASYLIGKDPSAIEDINQNFLRSVYFRGSVIMSANSAIDIALWDIKGKKLGVPVYELLGGKTREKVRVYASVMTKTEDSEVLAKGYLDLKANGFTAAKIFVNGPIRSSNEGRDEFFSSRIQNELQKVRICREAVGYDFDFILEAHRGMTVPEAISFGRAVEAYRPMVLEDPIGPDNIDSMAEVAAKNGVPIATGERYTNLREFEMLLSRRAAQYIRPDVCMCHRRNHYRQKSLRISGSPRCSGHSAQSAGTGLYCSLPADLRQHSQPGHSGITGILLKRRRRQYGNRTTPFPEWLHGNSRGTGDWCRTG